MSIIGSVLSIIAAILILAILIVLHELGHFTAAKLSKVRVDEFAIGFPPRIWSFKKGETQYSINALPIGGYVLMPGENGLSKDENGKVDPRSFAMQSKRKRAFILSAGILMNLLIAFVLYTGIFAVSGVPEPNPPPIVGIVMPLTPAQTGGLQANDRIISINKVIITSADQFHNYENTLIKQASANTQKIPVTIVVERNGVDKTLQISMLKQPKDGNGNIGFYFLDPNIGIPFWQAPGYALQQIFIGNFQLIGYVFQRVAIGAISVFELFSGPVGIVHTTSEVISSVATQGFTLLFTVIALISWSLALTNVLPIPGLDGGRILILGIEAARKGKRLSPEREAIINLIGLGFLFSLIILFTVNDIINILNGH